MGPAPAPGTGEKFAPLQATTTGVLDAAEGGTAEQATPDPGTIKMAERAIFLHHPYENRDRLRRVLPRQIDARSLDRVLEHLERSGKIAIDGGGIRWSSGTPGANDRGAGASTANNSILAGTRFEWMEKGKLATETVGEYIVRINNAHEPGTYTVEDAREFDEGMRRMAKGDYYTHEQVWKEFGP